jgi:hypothetical protein
VRDIVTADLSQAYAPRRAEAVAQCYRGVRFWQTGEPSLPARAQLSLARRAVDGEFGDALQSLLGADVVAPSTDAAWRQEELKHKLAFLGDDQRGPVAAVLLGTADLEPQIKALADGQKLTEDPASLQSIWADYEAKRDRLHALLTPEQYEEMELSVSWTAENVRRAMAHFDPTEQEFREIFRAWRAHDEDLAQRAVNGLPDPGNAHVFEQIRAVLGEERFRLYRDTWWR